MFYFMAMAVQAIMVAKQSVEGPSSSWTKINSKFFRETARKTPSTDLILFRNLLPLQKVKKGHPLYLAAYKSGNFANVLRIDWLYKVKTKITGKRI